MWGAAPAPAENARAGERHQHAALQPDPWLTAAALTLAALYALLAEGIAMATARNAFPAAERAQLTLLIAPVAGICAIAVAVTYRGGRGRYRRRDRAGGHRRYHGPGGHRRPLRCGLLAAGAVQLRALTGATTVPAAHAALATAAGHWTLIAAAVTGAVALALACTGRHRKGAAPGPGPGSRPGAAPAPERTPGSGKVAGGTPVPGAGATPDHG